MNKHVFSCRPEEVAKSYPKDSIAKTIDKREVLLSNNLANQI